MTTSHIRLIDTTTGDILPAAPDGTVLHSSTNIGWKGITVELHQIPPLELPEHYIEGHRLLVHVGKPLNFEWKDGSRWRQTWLKPGDFCLQTHGEMNAPRWRENIEFLAISLSPPFVSKIFEDTGTPEKIIFQERRGESDPIIANFGQRFKAELEMGSYCGTLYGESMALAFAMHLIEQHSHCYKSLPKPRGKLSSLQLRHIIEYLHYHLTEELSLIDLAAQINLSAYHFARLFKNSLGLSPHQYMLQNRVERAKKLITVSAHSNLTEIGLQVGFYDQAHFTKAFKRVVGVSPKAFSKQQIG
ncbi:helix-turn-helix domain-containing protein [Iningainema tapete]|uniref:Helix-turn-helix transcriptional regulator n=1 Tax=Iningainema tapete BLCC-T55 TaxID=2748662 RepID=A0A8J6XJF5_9CYAN|nr:AraC family transcriptional regulator [Iningainema tapete]MBD2773967.1 helix-turn-helix transcriptional regulator [Iningainema tapete BLCC-T55]